MQIEFAWVLELGMCIILRLYKGRFSSMKWVLFICISFFAVACIAKRLPYQADATMSAENSKAIVEQVLTEQKESVLQESFTFSTEYIELNYGTQRRVTGRSEGFVIVDGLVIGNTHNTETTKDLKKRIYYNSILECKLFSRGKWFIVQVVDTEQRVMHNFYCRNESKARKFGDALNSLKKNAKNPLESAPAKENIEQKQ